MKLPSAPVCDGHTAMTYPETQTNRAPDGLPFPPRGAPTSGNPPVAAHTRKLLEERLDQLGAQLSGPEAAADAGRISEMLLGLSEDIRAGSPLFTSGDFRWVLTRLTDIYAQGFGQLKRDAFANTAGDYARVIETISREYPGHDYSEAIGQLFCYMSRLFRTRKNGWKAVYEHIISIPDSVEAKQLLNRAFFVEIQEWAEAGVENLFSIRKDLYDKIAAIRVKIEALDRRIEQVGGGQQVRDRADTAHITSNVVDLAAARKERHILHLEQKRGKLLEERKDEEVIVGLIESDIREFEDKLRATRRAYFIRSV